MAEFNFFLPISKIEKQDDGSRLISGYASTPTKDLDGEIVSLDAIKNALPDYMEWGNIRQMHQPMAVGTAKEAHVDDIGLWLKGKIVDPACIKLIDEEVLKGFSIGGNVVKKNGDTITELSLIEISVVDRPANPDARFEIIKAAKPAGAGIELVKSSKRLTMEAITFEPEEVTGLRKFFTRLFKGGDAPGEGDKPYGDVEYADSGLQSDGKKRYPIDTEAHIRAAWSYIHKPKNAGQYTAEQLGKVKAKIVAAWKSKIDAKGPPDASEAKAAAIASINKTIDGHEAYDAQTALAALQSISQLLEWELGEDEGEDEQADDLREAIARLKSFIASEIMEDQGEPKEAAASTDPAAVTGGKSTDEATDDRSVFDQLKEHLKMANIDELLAKYSGQSTIAKRMSKDAMAKAVHHFGKAAECHKAAHGHMGKCASSMMAHVKAMKAAGDAEDHMTAAMGHMAAANAKMEEGADHHELGMHYMGKAAGAEGGEGSSVGGGATDLGQGTLTEGGVAQYSSDEPYPGKAARGGYSKEIVDQMVALAAKAAAAEAKAEVYANLPVGNPQRQLFAIGKEAFPVGGGQQQGGGAIETLFKNVNLNPNDFGSATEAAARVIENMHANPGMFAKSVTDPSFKGGAGSKRAN